MLKKILVVVLCGVLVSACTPKQDITDPATSETPAGKIAQLTVWTTESPDFFKALGREYLAETQRSNIRFKVVDFDDQAELKTYLIDSMASGRGPDIIYTDGAWISQNTNKLVPAKADDSFTPTNFRNTFVQSAQALLLEDEQIWGVPLGVDSLGLYYNEAHIQDRLPARNLPGRTWEEFQQDVIALTKTDNSFSRFAFSGAALGRLDNVTYGFDVLKNMFFQQNVSWFSPDGTQTTFSTTQGTVNGRAENLGEQALDLYTSFADDRFRHYSWNEFVATPNQPYADYAAFLKGEVSMVFGYTRDLVRLRALRAELQQKRQTVIPEGDIRVTFLPQVVHPNLSPTLSVLGEVYSLGVSRHSLYPDTAWDFLKFAINKDNLQSWHESSQLPTPRVDMLVEQEATPYIGIFVRQAKYAEGQSFSIPEARLESEFKSVIGQVESRKWSVLQALQKAAQNINQRLDSLLQRQRLIDS